MKGVCIEVTAAGIEGAIVANQLSGFSLCNTWLGYNIYLHTDGRTFDIHCLVHLATQAWLKSEKEFSVWQSKTVHQLVALLADADETM